jgi:spore germination cell wall hydrolase CwlJ-like protein
LRFRLPFTLVVFVVSGATPLQASIGVEPQCPPTSAQQTTVAPLKLALTDLSQAIPYDAEDRDYLIRTIAFEASDEAEEGRAAVAYVILNRMSRGWGDSIKDVVTQPGQFEPWMTRREEMEKLSQDDPRYRNAAQIADAVLSGKMPDPTAGATNFLNPAMVRQRRGGSLPAWAQGEGLSIGRHTFYAPETGGAAQETAPPSGLEGPKPSSRKAQRSASDRRT